MILRARREVNQNERAGAENPPLGRSKNTRFQVALAETCRVCLQQGHRLRPEEPQTAHE